MKSTLAMFREINLHWGILGAESAAWDAKPVSDEIPTSFMYRQEIECEYFEKEILRKLCDIHRSQRSVLFVWRVRDAYYSRGAATNF